jgi:hypothetical protein
MKMLFVFLSLLMVPFFSNSRPPLPDPGIEESASLYALVNLADNGLSMEIFQLALKGLHKLEVSGKLLKPTILTIADYSQSSNKKRLYVIDLLNKKLLFNTYVAHGRNTGDEYARSFSNKEGSLKSSLGFYITQSLIVGSHTGLALLINGVEKGFNDNATKREIIIHAADYATESFIKKTGRLGRSFGCPSLPPDMLKPVVETIKEGSCLFIYNPDKQYISSSSLLN